MNKLFNRHSRRSLVESLENRRLLSAGLLDTSFGTMGIATYDFPGRADRAYAVVASSDGTIYAAGSTELSSAPTNQSDFALVRFSATGTAITSTPIDFGGGQDFAYAMAQQADGRIIVAGVAYAPDASSSSFAITRTNADTSADLTFGVNGIVTTTFPGATFSSATGIAIQNDGKILVVGSVTIGANPSQLGVARYNADGTLDTTFGTNGLVTAANLPKATDVALAADGSIYISGNDGSNFVLMHMDSTGTMDAAFGTNGVVIASVPGSATAYSLALQADGKIVLAGEATPGGSLNTAMAFVRFNTNGTLDATFGDGGSTIVDVSSGIDQALSLVQQADGKLIAAGFTAGSGAGNFLTVRLTVDGQLDQIWGGDGIGVTDIGGLQDNARAATIDAEGRLIVAGQGTVGGSIDFAVARYTTGNADGIGIFRDGAWGIDSDSNRGWNPGSDKTFTLGQAGDIPIVGDWLGDGISRAGVFRDGTWILDTNGTPGFQADDTILAFGGPGMTPLVGDWNGDGIDDIGVFFNGQWALDNDGVAGWSGGDDVFAFGTGDMTPLIGDWDGDGKSDIGVFFNGSWALDTDGIRGWSGGDDAFAFGAAGMTPVLGDWDGDGTTDVGVFFNAQWALDSDGVRGWTSGDAVFAFGTAGWTPVIGDWNGDGKSDVGVFTGARWGLDTDGIRGWTTGDTSFAFGLSQDKPVIGKW